MLKSLLGIKASETDGFWGCETVRVQRQDKTKFSTVLLVHGRSVAAGVLLLRVSLIDGEAVAGYTAC